jgi:hypothetical protein
MLKDNFIFQQGFHLSENKFTDQMKKKWTNLTEMH